MRVVSWNCSGGFRTKAHLLRDLGADIAVVQECEDPRITDLSKLGDLALQSYWCGDSPHKGLGVFVGPSIVSHDNQWPTHGLRNFLSINVMNSFDLVAVWAMKPYIEELFVYESINHAKLSERTIVIGDFNSNAIWDHQHGKRSHSAVVASLESQNLKSAYHLQRSEDHGAESTPTFYLYRKLDRPFHIDYCFVDPARLQSFTVGSYEEWIVFSDHVPLIVDIDIAT